VEYSARICLSVPALKADRGAVFSFQLVVLLEHWTRNGAATGLALLAQTEVSESGRRVGQQGADSAKFGVGGGCSRWGLGTVRGAKCVALSGRRRSDAKRAQGDALG
jgi:hypothetical protein